MLPLSYVPKGPLGKGKGDPSYEGTPFFMLCFDGSRLAVTCLTHYLGFLVALSVVWVLAVTSDSRKHQAIIAAIGVIACGILIWAFRGRLISPEENWHGLSLYLIDLATLWLLVLVPLLAWVDRWSALWRESSFGRSVIVMLVAFLTFPLIAPLELGIYRDMDILSACVVLVAFILLGSDLSMVQARKRILASGIVGVPLLAFLIVSTQSVQGASVLEAQLQSDYVSATSRSYGFGAMLESCG